MKTSNLILVCLVAISTLRAQQKAVTETGDAVLLNDNGTWVYEHEAPIVLDSIPTNPTDFEKNDLASFLLKSNKINVGFWLDPKVWSFKKATDNPQAEYELRAKGKDLYAMIITEEIEIPLKTLKSVALQNGRNAAPDLKIIHEEYRMVNGKKVLLLQLNGTLQGIKFSYYGYYFSNKNGTVQFITYTSQNLMDGYKPLSNQLLNGLVELNKPNK